MCPEEIERITALLSEVAAIDDQRRRLTNQDGDLLVKRTALLRELNRLHVPEGTFTLNGHLLEIRSVDGMKIDTLPLKPLSQGLEEFCL